MTEVHRQTLPTARQPNNMFLPEGGGTPLPASTGISNGVERTTPNCSAQNTGHVSAMTSTRTPLPNAKATGDGTAPDSGEAAVSGGESPMPSPSLIPVGNGDFLSLSPLGIISGSQAVFLSASVEVPPFAPVMGIGTLPSVAGEVGTEAHADNERATSRVSDKKSSPEAPSTAVKLGGETSKECVEPFSNVLVEPKLPKKTADLNNGYSDGETHAVSGSPVEMDTKQSGLVSNLNNRYSVGEVQAVFESPVESLTMQSGLASKTQPVNDNEGFDDMIVFQDDKITIPHVPFEDGNQPSSLCGEAATDQDDQLPAFDGLSERVLIKEDHITSGEEEGLDTAGLQLVRQGRPVNDAEKKDDELTSTKNLGILSAEKTQVASESEVQAIVGRKVAKKFGRKIFKGEVVGYDLENQWFKVIYEDGDEEDLEMVEVKEILLAGGEPVSDDLGKRKRPSSNGGSGKTRKSKAKSQGIEKARGKSKGKGSSAQTKKPTQEAKSSEGPKKDSSKQSPPLLKSTGTGAEKQMKSHVNVNGGRKRLRNSGVEVAPDMKAISKTKQQKGSSPKKGGMTATKDHSKQKGARHPSLSDLSADEHSSKRRKVITTNGPESFVGRLVEKDFDGTLYRGKVTKFDRDAGYFKVKYDDGDQEDLEWEELKVLLVE